MKAKEPASLILTGKYLVTMDGSMTVIEDGGIAIAGDTIRETGKARDILDKYKGSEILVEEHGLIMPGLINVHTHAAMSCFRGLADDLPLMQWLQDYIFPVEATLTPELVYHSTLLSICEMIKSGTTSFCDMYLFAADVARAAEISGMRAWVGEVLYDFPSPNYGDLDNGFVYVEKLFQHYTGHSLITPTVDPHAVYTCSPGLLSRLGEVADQKNALYVIHLAENREEVDTCLERYGRTPVMHLEKLGLLNDRVVADHCVMLTDEEIDLMAERGVKIAHCPESNMKLASGIAPVDRMLAAGVTVGLGTDGSASNNDVDMFGEMDTAAKIHKVNRLDPTVIDAATAVRMATTRGADVLGAGGYLGSLEAGKKADLILIDLDKPHLTPIYNPLSHLVYAVRGADVKHTVINGRVVMRGRELTTLDEQSILEKMRQIGAEIKTMGE